MTTAAHTMTPAEIAGAVRDERLSLAEYLDGLTDAQWSTSSSCDAWTVRDVAAHLTVTTRATVPFLIRSVLRARGDFDRMTADVARDRAARFSTAEIVAQLRESADSSRRIAGSGPMDPLMDLVIHGLDIARPLGRPHAVPAARVLASLEHIVPNTFIGGPKRVGGLELVATDADWSTGEGPAVRGAAEDLLLVTAGRAGAVSRLGGPGVAILTQRLAA